MEHSPEPWEQRILYIYRDEPGEDYIHAGGNSVELCKLYGDNSAANARRIVACVNACVGISTKGLETFARDVENTGHDALELASVRGEYKTLLYERET